MQYTSKLSAFILLALPLLVQAGSCPDVNRDDAVLHLAVRGIKLGAGNAPCRPEARSVKVASGSESTMQMTCAFGDPKDSTRVFFSADRKKVIRVVRTQYLTDSDPSTADVLKEAIRFYGTPKATDQANELVAYGNPINLVRKGKAVSISRNACGVGLLITGQACGDGTFGLPDCKGLGQRYVNFDLVDNAELDQARLDGAKAARESEKKKLSALKF